MRPERHGLPPQRVDQKTVIGGAAALREEQPVDEHHQHNGSGQKREAGIEEHLGKTNGRTPGKTKRHGHPLAKRGDVRR